MGVCLSGERLDDEDDDQEMTFLKPRYYRDRDGPKFRVLNYTSHYEYRQYEKSTWICTRYEGGTQLNKSLSKGEKLLARYFHGRNGPEKSMELTCPMRLWVEFGKEAYGPCSDGEVVASLHLPYDCVSRPPAPVDSYLFIQEMPEHFAYVASFEGFATENMWHEEMVKLRRVLDGEGMKYNKKAFFVARYENILHMGKKRNEVLLVVDN